MTDKRLTSTKECTEMACLEAALAYAAAGWPVLPVKRDKTPSNHNGSKGATTDPEVIREWWRTLAPGGIGIATGSLSGLLVVDVDRPKEGRPADGEETLAALEAQHGPLPVTVEQRTGGAGRHLVFGLPDDGKPVPNSASKKLGPGLDVRGDGGYVVVAPSMHESGNQYSWVTGRGLLECPLAQAPQWLLDMARYGATSSGEPITQANSSGLQPTPYGQKALAAELVILAGTPEGQRNDQLNRSSFALGQLVAGGQLERTQVEVAILGVALAIGLGELEARRTIQSGLEDGLKRPRGPAEANTHNVAAGETEDGKGDDVGKGRRKEAQTDILLAIAEGLELFHTPGGDAYARVPVDQHYESHQIGRKTFKRWLGRQYYKSTGRVASAQALQDALDNLGGKAIWDGVEREVYVRVGSHKGRVYLDLGRNDWAVVEIDAEGWRVLPEAPIAFKRPNGMLPLPTPVGPGDLRSLCDLVNLGSEENFILTAGWLVGAMHPSGPYLGLALHGEQGSGKSLTARVLRRLIDPCKGELRSAPNSEDDLMIAAMNSHIVAFDNLGTLSASLSDALCRLATGGALSKRSLYTNDEEVIIEATRPMLLNGIVAVATRPDLVERSIVLSLPTIAEAKRRSEREIWKAFEEVQPRLLAGLLDAVSAALRNEGKVSLDNRPRMADAAEWVCQAEEALPWEQGAFLTAYWRNKQLSAEESLESDPVAEVLTALMADKSAWEGTPSDLYQALSSRADDRVLRARSWPGAPHVLSGRLTRLAPFLRNTRGLAVEQDRHADMRLIRISKIPSVISVTSVTGHQMADDGNDADDACDASLPYISTRQNIHGHFTDGQELWDGPDEVEI